MRRGRSRPSGPTAQRRPARHASRITRDEGTMTAALIPPSDAPADSAATRGDNALASRADRLNEISQIISAYNTVTQRLQESHDTLLRQVARLQEQLASADAALQRSKR